MRLSQLIHDLSELHEEYGNVRVTVSSANDLVNVNLDDPVNVIWEVVGSESDFIDQYGPGPASRRIIQELRIAGWIRSVDERATAIGQP